MRLGKTITTVKAVKVLKAFPCLIVAPFSAFLSWEQEIGINETIIYLTGTRQERQDCLKSNQGNKYYIINTEGFLALPMLSDIKWKSIIIDESRCIANPKSKISRFYVDNFKDVPVKFLLSGTPATENKLEYIQQLRFIDAVEYNYWEFRTWYCMRAGFKYVLTKKGNEELKKVLKEKSYILKLNDVKLNTKKIYMPMSIELKNKTRKKYLEIINKMQLDNNTETNYKPVSFIWARQLLGGFFKNKVYSREKFLFLKKLLEGELKNKSIIIFCSFNRENYFLKNDLSCLKNSCIYSIVGNTKILKRKYIIQDFNKGKIKTIVCQPEVTKFGLNLSKADAIIFFSTPLGLEIRYQCEARAMLPGKEDLIIIDLICKDTIEESIYKSLRLKETRVKMFERMVQHVSEYRPRNKYRDGNV